jgi:signal transduction histidine kinase
LAATEERHQLARAIHNQLGQGLDAVNTQLDTALALRAIDALGAEQAVRAAKQCASEALQDVRRSVGALRVSRADLGVRFTGNTIPETAPRGGDRPSWSVWLLPRTFDLVPTVTLLIFFFISLWWSTDDGVFPLWSWQGVVAALALIGLLAIDRVEYLRFGEMVPRRARLALVALRLVLCGVAVVTHLEIVFVLFALVQYVVIINFGTRWGLGALAIGWGIYVGVNVWAFFSATGLFQVRDFVVQYLGAVAWDFVAPTPSANPSDLVSSIVGLILISSLVLTSAQMMLSERANRQKSERLLAELTAADCQLQVYAAQTLAVNAERNHLAREIHDGLGHYLTVINVQLEKALAFRAVDPTVADQAIQDARRLVGDALQEIRETTRTLALAPETFSLPEALRHLAENVRGQTSVDLQIDGQTDGYLPQTLLVLYRVAQEGLTNVQKHAGASRVTVALSLGERTATLEVDDNGAGFDVSSPSVSQPVVGAGYGLRGLRERVELIGGTLALGSTPGQGTTLRVIVPKHARSVTAGVSQPEGGDLL